MRIRCPECAGTDLRVTKVISLPVLTEGGRRVVDWSEMDMDEGWRDDEQVECLECGWDGLGARLVTRAPAGTLEVFRRSRWRSR